MRGYAKDGRGSWVLSQVLSTGSQTFKAEQLKTDLCIVTWTLLCAIHTQAFPRTIAERLAPQAFGSSSTELCSGRSERRQIEAGVLLVSALSSPLSLSLSLFISLQLPLSPLVPSLLLCSPLKSLSYTHMNSPHYIFPRTLTPLCQSFFSPITVVSYKEDAFWRGLISHSVLLSSFAPLSFLPQPLDSIPLCWKMLSNP